MIYEYPPEGAPIRQGDIFVALPRIEVSLEKLVVLGPQDAPEEHTWRDLKDGQPFVALVPVRPVSAIVVTQDCDATTATDITLCEVRRFVEVEGKAKSANSPKAWMKIVTQHARLNLKWFYLPPDERAGLGDRMAADFRSTLRVQREDLERHRFLRRSRLGPTADEHFRARLSEFYRRYAYDEWYCLNTDEFATYRAEHPDAPPFPWQTVHGEDPG